MKYWIGVVSKDHVFNGIRDGIMQIGHGKRSRLARLSKNDWLIYYSAVNRLGDKEPLQHFTALGQIVDDDIYQVTISADFHPFRRRVDYKKVVDVPIRPLIDKLSFIKNKKSWGYIFRFGLLEIPEEDFQIIQEKMSKT